MRVLYLYSRSRRVSWPLTVCALGFVLLAVTAPTLAVPLAKRPIASLVLWLAVPATCTLVILTSVGRSWDYSGVRRVAFADAGLLSAFFVVNFLVALPEISRDDMFVNGFWPLIQLAVQICILVSYSFLGSRAWISVLVLISFLIVASSDARTVTFINGVAGSGSPIAISSLLALPALAIALHPTTKADEPSSASIF